MPAHKRHRPLKLWVRLLIASTIIILISVGIINIIEANDIEKVDDIITVSYNADNIIDYKVYYVENEFYKDEFYGPKNPTGQKNQFVSDLVRNIHFRFNYNFDISKTSYIEYEYDVKGTLIGNYEASAENTTANNLFSKEYDFGGDKGEKNATTGNAVVHEMDFDYQTYNSIISQYKEQLNIPITSYMELVFTVKTHAILNDEDITEKSVVKIKIPMNQKAFSIVEQLPQPLKKNIIQKADVEKVNKMQEYTGIALIISGIVIFIVLYKKLFNIKPKNHFNTELQKILKSYGDVIIELVNGINEEGMDIVLVKGFNELLDLEEELRIPINFLETYPNYEGEFSIVHDKIIYKYILTNEEY